MYLRETRGPMVLQTITEYWPDVNTKMKKLPQQRVFIFKQKITNKQTIDVDDNVINMHAQYQLYPPYGF